MMQPFFSVIIPTYNRAAFIEKAVRSVLEQSFADFEVIVTDDASTDHTAEIIRAIEDPRIVYFRNPQNSERCITRNRAIALARGRYICFLDSDDYHLPDHLEKLYTEISAKNFPVALFFTNAWNEDAVNGRSPRHCPDFEAYNPFHYIVSYTFNPQRACVHRDVFREFLFDPGIEVCEDVDLFARIKTRYDFFQVKERTTVYLFHSGSFTGGDPRKAFREYENYRKIFRKPELKKRIPRRSKNRIISMCRFHMAIAYDKQHQRRSMYASALESFFLCPRGYNRKTNKILLVMMLYNIPLLGRLIRRRDS
jgi:glycosyltransferase involved in cell wall biosynthesis